MYNFLLDLLSLAAILSGVLVITNKNPVISVIFLISLFINAAGYLIILGLGFVGIAYILIYIGAITVLFLFVIMMINIKMTDILLVGHNYNKNIPLAFAVSFFFIYEMFNILPFSINNHSAFDLVYVFNNLIMALNSLFLSPDSLLLNSDLSSINSVYISQNPITADKGFTNFLHIETLGQGIFTYGATWLIVLSFILLLSLVAPIILSKNNRTE